MSRIAALYEVGGVRFVKRSLFGIQGFGFVVTMFTSFFVLPMYLPTSLGERVFLAVGAFASGASEGVLAIWLMRPALNQLETWNRTRDPSTARATWDVVARAPLLPVRSVATYGLVTALVVAWTVAAQWKMDLDRVSVAALFVGSGLVWFFWIAVRLFAAERLLQPALAQIGIVMLEHDAPVSSAVHVSLTRRLLITVTGITVVAGTVVTGIVGDRTPQSLLLGIAASIGVTIAVTSWLMIPLARSITRPLSQLRAALTKVGQGDLDTTVAEVSADEIGSLAMSFNAMVVGLRERDRIRDTFGAYVDPAVAEHILTHGHAIIEGEDVEITALFLDVRGFTGYSETHTAREVVTMLNQLFELVVPVIARHGGHVDKFIGDGLLAVFGTPQPLTDHASRALDAACEIAVVVGDREPRIGMGLNSGTVVAGTLGGAGRYDFSVIGDVVNVAARVESATRRTGDTILVSEHTRTLLPAAEASALIARPAVPLKGRAAPVALYAPGTVRSSRVGDHRPGQRD
ncbi:adenylate/guanylate cyclase domain-containing protein [Antrihabitans sp. YC3-6]|uniref:Adenylate/guanylate cyclase domain-containing protein n=1 Tax=Antrihabitans stalagmiti TaxID=2799499 RepID=A0A934NUX9_9NOCA|nr:adenylate/guanylate cyclase domain-containing protein [Antrihabitans stalagmiti]MBJ8342024.1 adenylate/guanylate cyclase domain-containing protein [Antrihabitans stalagmiti]